MSPSLEKEGDRGGWKLNDIRNLLPVVGAKETVKPAFTLAEVLITLAIIGIVAALTIPGLMTNINSKVVENQKKVMTGKIVQGLNLLNSQENGLTKSYANSEEFVRALSKYMKMTTICGAGNLKDCLGYDAVNYDKDGEVKSVELSSITSASKLKLDDSFLAPAGFVMGDGTPVIVAWNSKCASGAQDATILDPDKPLKGIPTTCFAGIYDNNGTRTPNKYSKDVLSIGAARIGAPYLGTEIPEVGYVYLPNGYASMTSDQALSPDSSDQLKYDQNWPSSWTSYKSYWGGAKKLCEDQGMTLPTKDELIKMRNLRSKYPEIIHDSGWFWSSSEDSSTTAWAVNFAYGSIYYANNKHTSNYRVMCVGK